ncbi:MAG: glycoside hydrolase family 9 protein [Thermonemataceae bacterium]
MKLFSAIVTLLVTLPMFVFGQLSKAIRINQEGYHPNAPKMALVVSDKSLSFQIRSTDRQTTYYTGSSSITKYWSEAGENVVQLDFSDFKRGGDYVIYIPNLGWSYPFSVKSTIYKPLLKDALRYYYYSRASTAIVGQYGGEWIREAGHPDTEVVVHSSASSSTAPKGTLISSPKGWYDAGDYNKYIVNSGISTYTLLLAYEQHKALLNTLSTNIPESTNQRADILDEIKWNLDWMLKMQDHDGGVYHKLTNANFAGYIMPAENTGTRYVVKKTTAASLDFAAVMAYASRVYASSTPNYAQKCLEAAKNAYRWARKKPKALYDQGVMNNNHDPDIHTGTYDDTQLQDEFNWAAVELYLSTRNNFYYEHVKWESFHNEVPDWRSVHFLPVYSMLQNKNKWTSLARQDEALITSKLIDKAEVLLDYRNSSAAHISMGHWASDYGWGSNSRVANMGMLLIQAYLQVDKKSYLEAAYDCMDYLLGRNALAYCFVTNYGSRSPQNPHHRISQRDGIEAPIPGMLVGGPQSALNPDNCNYDSNLPAKKYVDDYCSYSTNEVAINWNAPLVYLAAGLQRFYDASSSNLQAATGNTTTPSTSELTAVPQHRIYPNPTTGTFSITLPALSVETAEVTLLNGEGQPIYSAEIQDTQELLVNKKLAPGIYLVRITTEQGSFTEKLIVQ